MGNQQDKQNIKKLFPISKAILDWEIYFPQYILRKCEDNQMHAPVINSVRVGINSLTLDWQVVDPQFKSHKKATFSNG